MTARRAAASLLLATLAIAGSSRAATLHGRVFTAEHEDSLARRTPVALLVESPGEQARRLETLTDEAGVFHFHGLEPDGRISYTLEVGYQGREFHGDPARFEPGEELIEINLLLASGPPAGDLPPDHPPIGEPPAAGRPVRQDPIHMTLIAVWVVLLFVWLARLSRPSPTANGRAPGGRERSPEAEALVREIAGLDNRHEEGVIGEEEYRKVRAGLLRKLDELAGGEPGS